MNSSFTLGAINQKKRQNKKKREIKINEKIIKNIKKIKQKSKIGFLNFSNFLLFNPVLQPSGVPGESQLVLTDGMGWDGMGWDGKDLFLFCLFLKNYLIYDANCFHAPSKPF